MTEVVLRYRLPQYQNELLAFWLCVCFFCPNHLRKQNLFFLTLEKNIHWRLIDQNEPVRLTLCQSDCQSVAKRAPGRHQSARIQPLAQWWKLCVVLTIAPWWLWRCVFFVMCSVVRSQSPTFFWSTCLKRNFIWHVMTVKQAAGVLLIVKELLPTDQR